MPLAQRSFMSRPGVLRRPLLQAAGLIAAAILAVGCGEEQPDSAPAPTFLSSTAASQDGPLSVAQARKLNRGERVTVRGWLIVSGLGGCPSGSEPLRGETEPGGGPACVNAAQGEVVAPGEVPPRTHGNAAATDQMRLCDLVLESLPPQCGRVFLQVEGLDADRNDFEPLGLRERAGVTWSESPVLLDGVVTEGVLHDSEWVEGASAP